MILCVENPENSTKKKKKADRIKNGAKFQDIDSTQKKSIAFLIFTINNWKRKLRKQSHFSFTISSKIKYFVINSIKKKNIYTVRKNIVREKN